MDDVQEITEQVKTEVKASIKRPIKVREIDNQAEEMKKERALPAAPGKSVDFESLVKWCKLLTPLMWNHLLIYVYRWEPVIMRDPKNIDVLSSMDMVDRDYMIENHGGGTFGFILKDTDKGHKEDTKVFEAVLKIPMGQYEPKLNFDELNRTHKDNRAYVDRLKAKGVLDAAGNVIEKEKPVQQQDTVGMVREIAGIIKGLNSDQQDRIRQKLDPEGGLGKSIGDILLEKMKQDDPTKQMAMFTSLLSGMKSVMPEPAKQDGGLKDTIAIILPLFTQMMANQAESNKQLMQTQSENSKMMIEAIKEAKQTNKDPLDSIDKILGITEKIRDAGGGENVKRGTLEVLVDAAREIVPSVLGNIRDMMVLAKMGPGAVPPSATQVNPGGQQQTPITEEIPKVEANELVKNLQLAGPMMLDHIINKGTDGASFAGMVVDMFGLPAHIALAKFGEENIFETLKAVPNLAQPLIGKMGEEYMKTWIYEFVHFKEILAEEGDTNGAEEIEEVKTESKGRGKKGKIQ